MIAQWYTAHSAYLLPIIFTYNIPLIIAVSCLSLPAVPPTKKPTPTKTASPVIANYTSNPSVNIVDNQSGQSESKPNFGLIFGLTFGLLALIILLCIAVFIIAKRRQSPRLEWVCLWRESVVGLSGFGIRDFGVKGLGVGDSQLQLWTGCGILVMLLWRNEIRQVRWRKVIK